MSKRKDKYQGGGGVVPLDLQGAQLNAQPTFQQQPYAPKSVDITPYFTAQNLVLNRGRLDLSRDILDQDIRQFNFNKEQRVKEFNLDVFKQLNTSITAGMDPSTGLFLPNESDREFFAEYQQKLQAFNMKALSSISNTSEPLDLTELQGITEMMNTKTARDAMGRKQAYEFFMTQLSEVDPKNLNSAVAEDAFGIIKNMFTENGNTSDFQNLIALTGRLSIDHDEAKKAENALIDAAYNGNLEYLFDDMAYTGFVKEVARARNADDFNEMAALLAKNAMGDKNTVGARLSDGLGLVTRAKEGEKGRFIQDGYDYSKLVEHYRDRLYTKFGAVEGQSQDRTVGLEKVPNSVLEALRDKERQLNPSVNNTTASGINPRTGKAYTSAELKQLETEEKLKRNKNTFRNNRMNVHEDIVEGLTQPPSAIANSIRTFQRLRGEGKTREEAIEEMRSLHPEMVVFDDDTGYNLHKDFWTVFNNHDPIKERPKGSYSSSIGENYDPDTGIDHDLIVMSEETPVGPSGESSLADKTGIYSVREEFKDGKSIGKSYGASQLFGDTWNDFLANMMSTEDNRVTKAQVKRDYPHLDATNPENEENILNYIQFVSDTLDGGEKAFRNVEKQYLSKTKYEPAIDYAEGKFKARLPKEIRTYIADMANQHGGYRKIINNALEVIENNPQLDATKSRDVFIALEEARTEYMLTGEGRTNLDEETVNQIVDGRFKNLGEIISARMTDNDVPIGEGIFFDEGTTTNTPPTPTEGGGVIDGEVDGYEPGGGDDGEIPTANISTTSSPSDIPPVSDFIDMSEDEVALHDLYADLHGMEDTDDFGHSNKEKKDALREQIESKERTLSAGTKKVDVKSEKEKIVKSTIQRALDSKGTPVRVKAFRRKHGLERRLIDFPPRYITASKKADPSKFGGDNMYEVTMFGGMVKRMNYEKLKAYLDKFDVRIEKPKAE